LKEKKQNESGQGEIWIENHRHGRCSA